MSLVKTDLAIEVKGKIQIGKEQILVREFENKKTDKQLFVTGPIHGAMPEHRRKPLQHARDTSGVDATPYKYVLEDTDNNIEMLNKGMCQSYGIFGIPGCGKTYLLKHLLEQIVSHRKDDPEYKFGGLILDPKAALLGDIQDVMEKVGRSDDLIIINEDLMEKQNRDINVIDTAMDPVNMGKILSMAAQAAGIKGSDPFWLNEIGTLFGAALHMFALAYNEVPTLYSLIDIMLRSDNVGTLEKPEYEPRLKRVIDRARKNLANFPPEEEDGFEMSCGTLNRFLYENVKDKPVISSFIEQGFGSFRRRQFRCFSAVIEKDSNRMSLYDEIIEKGKIVLVSVSKRNIAISKILCSVIKCLFQQNVITRLDRHISGEIKNYKRPLIFAADEYSDVATEVQGQPMGDSLFFSQMRQFGCMGLIATQSIHMLKNSSLGESWKAIYSNFAAKIFMQIGDPETAEEASKLVGEAEFHFRSMDKQYNKDGSSTSIRNDLKDKKELPTKIVTQSLGRGEAVVIGALGSEDGSNRPGVYFVFVNKRPDQFKRKR